MIARGVYAVIQKRPRLIPGEGLVLIYSVGHRAELPRAHEHRSRHNEPEERAARAGAVNQGVEFTVKSHISHYTPHGKFLHVPDYTA